jgi:hypothetical protein
MPYVKARIRKRRCLFCDKPIEGNAKKWHCNSTCRARKSRANRERKNR